MAGGSCDWAAISIWKLNFRRPSCGFSNDAKAWSERSAFRVEGRGRNDVLMPFLGTVDTLDSPALAVGWIKGREEEARAARDGTARHNLIKIVKYLSDFA